MVSASPHEFTGAGGMGTTCASIIHATVEPLFVGAINVGGSIVYVYTQSTLAPVQSVNVQVHVLSPEHTGSDPSTGPVTVSASPHEFTGAGGVGTTCASIIHATVEPLFAGGTNVGGVIV